MRRTSALVALIFAVGPACTAHEPPPRLVLPDEPAPALAEWKGAADPPAQVVEGEAAEPEPEPAPVKVVESHADEAYERGKRNARAAIARDQLGLETFGYPARCRQEYRTILRRDYKVSLHEVAGCVVDDSILEHARGYNEVMVAEIERRHGTDALKRAGRQAGC